MENAKNSLRGGYNFVRHIIVKQCHFRAHEIEFSDIKMYLTSPLYLSTATYSCLPPVVLWVTLFFQINQFTLSK